MARAHQQQRIPHVRPGDVDERQCPACSREFKTSQGLMSHLSSAQSCKWYKKGKNKDISAYSVPEMTRTAAQAQVAQHDAREANFAMNEDEQDFEDIMESHDLFELIPPITSLEGLDAASSSQTSAGPSQNPQAERRRAQPPPSLNDDEDTRVVDEPDEELVGKVVKMSEAVVEKWKAYFWEEPEQDKDRMDVDEEPLKDPNIRWKPFASELDCKVAMWVVREDIGQNALNRLLAIPGVRITKQIYTDNI